MRDSVRNARPVNFSERTNWDTGESAWAQTLASRRERGLPVYDLTAANPTHCGFAYDEDLLAALQNIAALNYDPDPRGVQTARAAVCTYYRDHMAVVSAPPPIETHQIFLTTSTSEAYSFLFRLLCDPGDEILIAQPSYPLFEFLARVDDVRLVTYPLFYDYGWHLDLHGLRQNIGPRTRAIVLVHPNNPTGHFTREADRKALEAICAEFGLALIIDEVFLDYSLTKPAASFIAGPHPVLTFVLSGLSKIAALPQMKLSWIAACGPSPDLENALDRLEVIADTFLSLSAPLQHALPTWLCKRNAIQQQILTRFKTNLRALDTLLLTTDLVDRLVVEAGWYVIVRTPALRDGEQAALWLLTEAGVAVHPGSFFGIAGDGCFVVSLLTDSDTFLEGATRLVRLLGNRA